jgi:hypothetical protein
VKTLLQQFNEFLAIDGLHTELFTALHGTSIDEIVEFHNAVEYTLNHPSDYHFSVIKQGSAWTIEKRPKIKEPVKIQMVRGIPLAGPINVGGSELYIIEHVPYEG